ncbi:MAG: hypothetical protein LBF09_02375, partial [Odoribacteraceae bacterium]|nr:hypothetical protein [Odoribacteraceae bacterium]
PAPANRFAPFPAGPDAWGFVEVDRQNRASIVITDDSFRRELFRYRGRDNELFIHPSFDGTSTLLAVSLSPAGQQILSIDTRSGRGQPLAPPVPEEIDRPVAARDGIIYRSARGGNNAIYRSAPDSLLVEARFGARYPALSPGKDTLYFSFYTPDGYRPACLPLARALPALAPRRSFALADSLARDEQWNFSPPRDSATYTGQPYNKTLHAVNVHSWGPFFPDRDNVRVYPGLAISSQDKLSTFYWTAGHVWDDGYDNGNWKLNATYRGLWPTFKASLRDGRVDRQMEQRAARQATGQVDTIRFTDRSRETRLSASVEFPVNFSRGDRRRYIAPRLLFSLRDAYRHETDDLRVLEHGAWKTGDPEDYRIVRSAAYWSRVIQHEITFYSLARASQRDLYPRRGERLEVGYARAFSSGNDPESTWWANGNLYLPGVARHHAIVLYAGFQQKSDPLRLSGNQILSPRGISLSGNKLATARFSYYLPLAYPDWRVTPLVYLRQFNAGIFFDAAATVNAARAVVPGDDMIIFSSPDVTRSYRSFGIEATSDARFLDLTFPVNVGFRAGYETLHRDMFFNLLFSIGLSI